MDQGAKEQHTKQRTTWILDKRKRTSLRYKSRSRQLSNQLHQLLSNQLYQLLQIRTKPSQESQEEEEDTSVVLAPREEGYSTPVSSGDESSWEGGQSRQGRKKRTASSSPKGRTRRSKRLSTKKVNEDSPIDVDDEDETMEEAEDVSLT